MRRLSLILIGLGVLCAAIARQGPRTVNELVMADGDRADVCEGLGLHLDHFEVERYPSGKPRQFVSAVKVVDREGKTLDAAEIRVNRPLRRKDWWIYQFSYGPDETGTMCTLLRCVKDTLLPLAALGGLLMLLGAAGLCWTERTGGTPVPQGMTRTGRMPVPRDILSWGAAALAVSVPIFIIVRAVLRPEPIPALQSPLMAPHVAAYAGSYLILTFAAFGVGRRFMSVGFFLMTVGLVLGAVWGKVCWGDYWQYDPKEMWGLATWLTYFAVFAVGNRPRLRAAIGILGVVLILLTATIANFSRIFAGLHSYA